MIFKKISLLLTFLILMGSISTAQSGSDNIRSTRKFGLSAKAGGVLWIGGVSLDYYIAPNLNVEVVMIPLKGAFFGIGTGLEYHHWGADITRKWSPYIGLKGSYFEFSFTSTSTYYTAYFPIGVSYISNKGFNFAIDVGLFIDNEIGGSTDARPWASMKLGYRFL